jgi:uncharacterized repeat protein (TIGR03833 family)
MVAFAHKIPSNLLPGFLLRLELTPSFPGQTSLADFLIDKMTTSWRSVRVRFGRRRCGFVHFFGTRIFSKILTRLRPFTMSIPSHNQISRGVEVSVILKEDQPTGRQVQGIVEDVLTQHDHPRGVKVLLMDGRVGRVQEVLNSGYTSATQPHNTAIPDPQNWQAHTGYPSEHPSSHTQHSAVPDPQNWQAHTSFPSGYVPARTAQQQTPYTDSRPTTIGAFDDSPNVPPEERSEQMEYLQSYENSKPETEDDTNQATLQREFPNIDSSLIAALYGDSKSLSATREMLQELND